MATQNIPVLQQNSLPLQTIAQATAGVVVNFGAGIARYWDSTALGVNGVAPQTIPVGAAFYYYFASNWLDVRGCDNFAVLVNRHLNTSGAAQTASSFLHLQYRMGVTDNPAVTFVLPGGTGINEVVAGKLQVANLGAGIWIAGTAGQDQRVLTTITAGSAQPTAGTPAMLGYDVRFIFSWSTNPPTGDASTYSMWLWGQG